MYVIRFHSGYGPYCGLVYGPVQSDGWVPRFRASTQSCDQKVCAICSLNILVPTHETAWCHNQEDNNMEVRDADFIVPACSK
jgi:hypothetical protein